MVQVKYPVALVAVFLWVGFVGAISFMEAWLKFRARGITLPIGLEVGRLVFNALNKAEWIFAIAILANIFLEKAFGETANLFYCIPLFLLLLQTIWLLPAMGNRVEMLINGNTLNPSPLHFYYVAMEVVKVCCLFIFGIKLFK